MPIPPRLPKGPKTRAHARAKIPGQVMIHDEERLFIAPLSDISAGGLFVEHLVHIPVGRAVKLVVKGNRLGFAVQAEGTVVRVEKAEGRRGMAVQFTELSEKAKEAIQACVFEMRMETALKAA